MRRRGAPVSVGLGGGLGLAMSIPPLLFFQRPMLLNTPLEYRPVAGLTRPQLLAELLLRLPLNVALFEETAFRGLLYSSLRARFGAPLSLAVSAAVFAGWHFHMSTITAGQTNLLSAARLPRFLLPHVNLLTVLGSMLSTGVAGVGFGLLREASGNLAGPIIAHWLVDGIMIASLWRSRPKPDE